MTPQQISTDIERGLELRNLIKASQTELKAIEKRLEQAGLEGEQIPLQEADREGRQFIARSPKLGIAVPVIFESDQIVASYKIGSQIDDGINEFVMRENIQLADFYQPVTAFNRVPKDGQDFRRIAREKLGSLAPGFVALCLQRDKDNIPRSRTIISWDNSKPLDQVTA